MSSTATRGATERFDYFAAQIQTGRRPVEFLLWAERITPADGLQVLAHVQAQATLVGDVARVVQVHQLRTRTLQAQARGRFDATQALDLLLTLASPIDDAPPAR